MRERLRFALLVLTGLLAPQAPAEEIDVEARLDALFAAYAVPVEPGAPARREVVEEIVRYEGQLDALLGTEVNFAGHYRLASAGCGTECQVFLVANPDEGDARHSVVTGIGARFRSDSRLFVGNDPDEILLVPPGEYVPSRWWPRCWIFESAGFVESEGECVFTAAERERWSESP